MPCFPKRATASLSCTTAESSRGIEPWPGSPVARARTQHTPFSATCTVKKLLPATWMLKASALTNRELAAHEVGVVLAEPERAATAPSFLIGHASKNEISLGLHPFARESSEDGDRHGGHVLHVDRAATPQATIMHLAAKRRMVPSRRVRLDDVEVCG